MHADKETEHLKNKAFNKEGIPLKVLSTSLGVALLANMVFAPNDIHAETASQSSSESSSEPQLVEWSTDAVKQYYDPSVDWNLPLPSEKQLDEPEETEEQQVQGNGGSSGGTTVVYTNGSNFGWDDLMLYHLMFNSGSSYSSQSWSSSHKSYNYGTTTTYRPKTHTSDAFQNKTVVGSAVKPKTSQASGTITRRSTSSKPGDIGGKSSGFSSSGTTSSTNKATTKTTSKSTSKSSSKSSSSSSKSGGFGG